PERYPAGTHPAPGSCLRVGRLVRQSRLGSPGRERPGDAGPPGTDRCQRPELSTADCSASSGLDVPSTACWMPTCRAVDSSWYFGVVGRGNIRGSATLAAATSSSWPFVTAGSS